MKIKMVAGAGFHFGLPGLSPSGGTHFVRAVQKYLPDIFVNQLSSQTLSARALVRTATPTTTQIKKARLPKKTGFFI
jgi:hypothetical protein